MQKKNCETHDYAKKDKKHTIMQKKIKKHTMMQTNEWETRNYAKAKNEAAHRYICSASKICKTENKQ